MKRLTATLLSTSFLVLVLTSLPISTRAKTPFTTSKSSWDHGETSPLSWAKGAVWYQIFPDRFYNGDHSNDPRPIEAKNAQKYPEWHVHPWTSDFYKMQPYEKKFSDSFYKAVWWRHYGGDLIGVIEKLDYLNRLGIDAIYFNPLFESKDYHRYSGSTYHHIDNNLGPNPASDREKITKADETENPKTWIWTEADLTFLKLIREAHRRDIKVIIDGVFNHTGRQFFAFQSILKKGRNSRYSNWYEIKSWDDPSTPKNEFEYSGWAGFKALPELKEDSSGLVMGPRKYIFNATRRWMDPNGDGDPSDGIDGWRLDVSGNVAAPFWRDWNKLVKKNNPGAITISEHWSEEPGYLEKTGFDALMNYPFAREIVPYFAAGNVSGEIKYKFKYKFVVDGNWDQANKKNRKLNLFKAGDTVVIQKGDRVNREGAAKTKSTGKARVKFQLDNFDDASSVTITGDFNNWNKKSRPLNKTKKGWITTRRLSPGLHEFKYIVDGKWDTANPENRVIFVAPNGNITRLKKLKGHTVTFRLEGYPRAESVTLAGSFNEWSKKGYEMHREDGAWEIDWTFNSSKKKSPPAASNLRTYGFAGYQLLWNLFGSHDTDRLASQIINKNPKYDHQNNPRSNPNYKIRKPNSRERKIQKQLVAFQMTFAGAPMIYYGDEAGMWGPDDPGCRKPFPWPGMDFKNETHHPLGQERPTNTISFEQELHDYYQQLIHLRQKYPVLQKGKVKFLPQPKVKGIVGFKRETSTRQFIALFNRNGKIKQASIPGKKLRNSAYTELLGDEKFIISNNKELRLKVAGHDFRLLLSRD